MSPSPAVGPDAGPDAESVDLAGVAAVISAFESSDWEEIHLVSGGVEIRLSVHGGSVTPTPPARPTEAPAARTAEPGGVAGASGAPAAPAAPAAPPAPPAAPREATGTTTVAAPTVGVFWRSPAPGAPPFVEVGDVVGPEDTLGILEVMKLMTNVRAGFAGTVVTVLVENGAQVGQGDPLVVIEQARPPGPADRGPVVT